MANFVFANNIKTTVASAFSNVATSLTLASSVGLPTLSAGQVLPITLNDAATGLVYEICYATAITGATLTVTRAQEGTAAQNWSVGDRAYCAPTALSVAPVNGNGLNVFQVANAVASNEAVNLGQVPAITVNDATNAHYAVAGKNVYIGQDINLQTWADSLPRCGMYDAYLTVAQGNLPAAYWHLELQRYSSDVAGNLTHIITAKGLNVAGLMYTNTCSGGIWSGWIQVVTSIAGTAPNATNAANVTGTIGASVTGTTQATSDNSPLIATDAFVHAVANPGASLGTNGYQKFPSGLIVQWGNFNAGSAYTTVNFPIAFPNLVLNIITSPYLGPYAAAYPGYVYNDFTASNTSFYYFTGGVGGVAWLAVGY